MLWVGSLRLCQYPVPCQISIDYSWWINHLCACCQMEIFYSHHSFYMDLLAFYHKEKLFPFSCFFVSPRVHGFLFYDQFLSLFIFMLNVSSRSPFKDKVSPAAFLTCLHVSLIISLLLGTTRISRFIFSPCIFLASPLESAIYLISFDSFQWRMVKTKVWALSVLVATRMLLLLSTHRLVILELVMNREAWHAAVHGVTRSQTGLSNWTELNWPISTYLCMYVSSIFGSIYLCVTIYPYSHL